MFTDKTGTLTKNELVLRELYVGEDLSEYVTVLMIRTSVASDQQEYGVEVASTFTNQEKNRQFTTCVLLCNSCVRVGNKLKSDNPDELALLFGVQSLGGVIQTNEDKSIMLRLGEMTEKWTVLKTLPFTSDRKRMSVVVQNEATQTIRVYVKVLILCSIDE